jgi:hypothetical protein
MGQEKGMQAKAADQDGTTAGWLPDVPAAAPSGGSRALVPVHSGDAVARRGSCQFRNATFLAHLIAVDRRVPQLRVRRRADPADAVAVYTATLTPTAPRTGRKLRRSV